MCGQFVVDERRYACYVEKMLISLCEDKASAKGPLLTVAFVNQIRPYNHFLRKTKNAQSSALEGERGIVNIVRVQYQTFALIYARGK